MTDGASAEESVAPESQQGVGSAEITKDVEAILLDADVAARPTNPMTAQDIKDRKVDRTLREAYANKFFYLLMVQLVVMNIVFILVGTGHLVFPGEWTLNLYMAGTLAEVFLIVREIVKYLFPKPGNT